MEYPHFSIRKVIWKKGLFFQPAMLDTRGVTSNKKIPAAPANLMLPSPETSAFPTSAIFGVFASWSQIGPRQRFVNNITSANPPPGEIPVDASKGVGHDAWPWIKGWIKWPPFWGDQFGSQGQEAGFLLSMWLMTLSFDSRVCCYSIILPSTRGRTISKGISTADDNKTPSMLLISTDSHATNCCLLGLQ